METPVKSFITRALGATLLSAAAACSPHHEQITVQDLLDDRVKLDGVLMKCNQHPGSTEAECANARIAAERLSSAHDEQRAAQRSEDFERRREELRLQQERERQSQEAPKPDPYHLPVVPVEPPSGAPSHN